MPTYDFDDDGDQPQRREPIEFKLGGEVFHALPEAPAGVLNDLLAGIQLDEQGNRIYSAPNLMRFVIGILVDELEVPTAEGVALGYPAPADDVETMIIPADDVQRFHRLLNDKHNIVPIEKLARCVITLSEGYGQRPFDELSPSRRGQARPGRRSGGG